MLKNPRWEKFAQGVAKGLSVTDSYKRAGFSPKSAGQGGDRLCKNVEISRRIEEIRAKLSAKMEYAREDFIRDLRDRFAKLPADNPVTARYGEMLAKAQGWNEPDKLNITGQTEVRVVIGGNADNS